MNTIPPQIESAGLRAYEQARAFETLRRGRVPLVYSAIALVLLLGGGGALLVWNRPVEATLFLMMGIIFPFLAYLQWQRLRQRHDENVLLLAELEKQYGEDLPWLQVERHFAALEQLQRELAQEEKTDSDR